MNNKILSDLKCIALLREHDLIQTKHYVIGRLHETGRKEYEEIIKSIDEEMTRRLFGK